jgi:DNA-binding NarL/FixJ family response regulator
MMAAGGPYIPADVLEQMKLHEDRWGDLTDAESSVAVLVAEGLSDKEIAARLEMAPRTVENHVRSLLRKAEVDNRTRFAVAFYRR